MSTWGPQSRGDIYFKDSVPGKPITNGDGVDRIVGEDGTVHQSRYVDLDSDGDVDADWKFKNKAYFVFEREVHDRFIPASGVEEGRIVRGADSTGVWITSALNYSGSTHKDLVLGRYEGPSNPYTEFMRFDKSSRRATAVSLTVAAPVPPVSASSTGTPGQIEWDGDYVYVCVATNTWKRTALSAW